VFSPKAKIESIFKNPNISSVITITGLYFLSRVLGFARNFVSYQKLTRLESDLLSNADKIPNIIASILLMGTIFSSALPVVTRLESQSKDRSGRYISLITLFIFAFLTLILGFCWLQMEWLLELITSEHLIKQAYDNGLWEVYLLTARISLIIPFNFAIQAITGVLLNFNKKFFIFSLAGAIANVGSIVGLYFTKGDFIKVVIGMLVATTLSSILYLWSCLKLDYKFNFDLLIPKKLISEVREFEPELKQTIKVFLPRLALIDGFMVAGLVLGRIVTSTGQISAFEIASSIQSTFLIVMSSLGIVFFPDLSKTLTNKNLGFMVFWEKISKYLKISMVIGFVISLMSIFGSYWVMKLFELAGKGQDNAEYIVFLVQISSFRLFFSSIKEILDKYLYAKEKQWTPMWLSLVSVFAQIVVFGILYLFKFDAGLIAMIMFLTYYMVWCLLAIQVLRSDYIKNLPDKYKIYTS
jgi:peptidoglycan biosynthesis protein MviN/MurJ (putative lipid II flippase)